MGVYSTLQKIKLGVWACPKYNAGYKAGFALALSEAKAEERRASEERRRRAEAATID